MALNVGELYASFGIDSKGLDSQISGIQKKCESIAKGLTKGGAVMTAAITAPVIKAGTAIYKAGTDFQSQMSRVQAIAGLDSTIEADSKAIDQLTAAALEMGSTTSFTASEAGEALEYMAMAGWKTDSMLAGLKPVMDLAAASGESLGATSDIVTDAMTAFGYTLDSVGGDTDAFSKQVAHFSDVLASAATNANTNVGMMGESFKYVAPLAGSLGYSVDDIAVALGLMANNGIKGSQAGTSLRTVLNNLIKPTESQEAAMKSLGLSLYDSNGKVKDFSELMGDMRKVAKESGVDMKKVQKEVAKLDEQLEKGEISEKEYNKAIKEAAGGSEEFLRNVVTLSGARGLGAMLAIMNASESDFNSLTEAITHCDGATAKMAKTMLDNTKGKVTLFKSALEGLEITLWTQVAPAFDTVVEKATEWVDTFRKSSPVTQKAVLKMAGLAAAAGPVMLAMGRVVAIVGKLGPALAALVSPMGIVAMGLGLMAVAAVDANNDIGKTLQKMSKTGRRHLEKFNKGILDTFDTISGRIPALAKSLSNIFRDDLPTAVDTAMLTLQGFAQTLSENSDEILGVGVALIEGLAKGVSRNLPQLIPVGIQMIASMTGAIIKAVPTLVKAVVDLGASVVKGLLDTDWTEAGTTILNAISTAVSDGATVAEGIADTIVSLVNTYFTAEKLTAGLTNATAFAEAFFTAITNALTTIGETGVNIVDKIVGAITTMIDGMSGTEFTGKLGTLAKAIIEGIVNSLVSLGTAGSDILTSIINGISTILGKITDGDFTSNMSTVAESIMTAIGNGIGTINLASGDIRSKLVTAIGGLLEKINVSDFVSGFTTVATTLVKGLGNAIGTSFRSGGEIIKGIATMLSTALSNGNISGIVGNLSELGLSVVKAIGEAIKGAAGGAASLISAVGELIKTALEPQSGESLIGNLSTLGSAIIKAIVQAISDAGEAAGTIVSALSDVISGINWGEAGVSLGTFVTNMISSLSEELGSKDFSGVISSIGTGLGNAAGALTTMAAKFAGTIIKYLLNPKNWEGLVTGLVNLVRGIFEGIGAAIDAWKSEFFGEFDTLTIPANFTITPEGQVELNWETINLDPASARDFAQFLSDSGVIEKGFQLTDEGSESVPIPWSIKINPELENLDYSSPEWKQIFENYRAHLEGREPEVITVEQPIEVETTGVEGGEQDPAEQIRQSMEERIGTTGIETDATVTTNVTEVNVGDETSIQSNAQAAVDTALAAVNLTADVSVSTAVTIEISDTNAAEIGNSLGTDLGTNVASGVANQKTAVAIAAAGLATAAMSPINSACNGAYTLGSNFGQGLADGINSKVGAVRAAAQAVADAAKVTVPKVLEEHSPSKAARRFGAFFGEGLAIGIHDKIKAVKKQSSVMASTAKEALSMNPMRGLFGDASRQAAVARRNAIDYTRLAAAMAAAPAPVLQLDGRTVAEVNADNTAKAQNGRTKTIAMRYGSR